MSIGTSQTLSGPRSKSCRLKINGKHESLVVAHREKVQRLRLDE
jgi:hypothetical protein